MARRVLVAASGAVLLAAVVSGRPVSARTGLSGVVLTSRGGGIVAVNLDGPGVRELTHPRDGADDHDPAASPDGSTIAFSRSYGSVYVLNADGSGLRRVGPGIAPQWSPDGRSIAASTFSPDEGLGRVYVMTPDGAGPTQIGRGEGPAWSSDGRWLAYEGDLRNDEPGIYVAHPDGSAKRRLPKAWGFAWAPAGSSLAYVDDAGIELLDAETGQQRRLAAKRLFGVDADPGGLSWSPDGRALALVAKPYGEGSVYVVPLDGSEPRKIGPPTEERPVWSPDATRIAYAIDICCPLDGSGERLTVVDVATGRRTMTVPPLNRAGSGEPLWSPDGGHVLFLRGNTPGAFAEDAADLWVVAADGSGLSRLTSAFPFSGVADPPTWWAGRGAIPAVPGIATVPLAAVAKRQAQATYTIVGADGGRVAVDSVPPYPRNGARFVVSRAGGRGAWARVDTWANSVGFAGRRVYWASNDRKDMWLYTAARPGARPRELRYVSGYGGRPYFTVRSDRSLVAYTLGRSLWLIRGTHMRRIRRESNEITLLDVDGRRELLLRAGGVLELVSSKGKLLRSFPSRGAQIQDGALSGRRVIGIGKSRFLVFDSRTGRLRASWRVGAPGIPPSAGFVYQSLLPYADGSALHVLDVDTGHDLVLRLRNATMPVDGAVTRRGLLYTWTAECSSSEGRAGVVPLAELRAALKTARVSVAAG
jgi:TolB protein